MAICEVSGNEVLQRCEKCSGTSLIGFAGLVVGIERGEQTDPRIVALPPCQACGSREFLIRTGDQEPEHPAPGGFGHLHQLLVDHVHAELVRQGHVTPSLRDRPVESLVAKTIKGPEFRRWFPSGSKLAPPEGLRERPAVQGQQGS